MYNSIEYAAALTRWATFYLARPWPCKKQSTGVQLHILAVGRPIQCERSAALTMWNTTTLLMSKAEVTMWYLSSCYLKPVLTPESASQGLQHHLLPHNTVGTVNFMYSLYSISNHYRKLLYSAAQLLSQTSGCSFHLYQAHSTCMH